MSLFCKRISTWGKFYNKRLYSCKMSKTALIILADGAEELESVSIIDVLRRGEVEVTIAGLCGDKPIICSHNTKICPDISLECVNANFDAVILPGGMEGAKALAHSAPVGRLLKEQEKSGRIIAAICAAPTALKAHCIGDGKQITSYPAMETQLRDGNMYCYRKDRPVVVDGNIITSRGPATAFQFSLTILEQLCGYPKALDVAKAMLYDYKSAQSPWVLNVHSIGRGRCITSYPSFEWELRELYKYMPCCPVVIDGQFITSRGPATAFLFSLAILEQLCGKHVTREVAEAMLYVY